MENYIPPPLSMRRTPVSMNSVATAPFATRPPSPPSVFVPSFISRWEQEKLSVVPSFDNVDPLLLTREDLAVITQNQREQIARDNCEDWKYESRREAQQILDFLFLGPSYIAKNKEFLQKHGISLLLGIRDCRMVGTRLMSVQRVAEELGIESAYIDVVDHQELIRAFPIAVKTINDHLLSVYRSQAVEVPADVTSNDPNIPAITTMDTSTGMQSPRRVAIDKDNFRRGKVLVFCETGNDRSASVVAAYLMTVYGMTLVRAVQFISLQRFCASFDEESKLWLQSYEGILEAKRTVHREATPVGGWQRTKRTRQDVMDEDEDNVPVTAGDSDRFTDRPAFAPFADGDVQMG